MKILLIGNYIPDAQQSMQRYAAILQHGFNNAGHDARLIRPSVKVGTLKRSGKWLGYIDKLVLFPREHAKALEWADVIHICDHSNALYMKYIEDRPHVVTCHDMLAVRSAMGEFPENRTGWSGRCLQRMILDGLSRARNIVCVSEATRADLVRLLPVGNRQVTCIYNGLNYPYTPMPREEADNRLTRFGLAPTQRFILHVGGNQWYKNRFGVLKIFFLLLKRAGCGDLLLVMAGKPWTREMRQFARANQIERSAVELTGVAEEDLRALYSRAEVLLFPSLAEGFGWPVAEAQSCGCPVVASNRAPMTEVGGSAAVYVDPLDYESAAAAVAGAIGSRSVVHETSRSNASRFSSAVMIESWLSLYSSVAGIDAPGKKKISAVAAT